MKAAKKVIALLLIAAAAFSVVGCSTNEQDTSIPWSRPAGWEGQVPGMGTTPGSGIR